MSKCFFVTDLHGREDRYAKLFQAVERELPAALFLGGDILPSGLGAMVGAKGCEDFIQDVLASGFTKIKNKLGQAYPSVFTILGNDDARISEQEFKEYENRGLWKYIHNKCVRLGDYAVYGYAFVPPTPFKLKDWERYDVSRYLDPLSVAPEEGWLSVSVSKITLKHQTIQNDLQQLTQDSDLAHAVFLFHSPPHDTRLDRAALDGKKVNYVQLDVHVGSIAIRRFIESKQPLLTLHGHIHESARITGSWKERIGKTHAFSAAHDGPELALVRFDLDDLGNATRELI
jgi:uncharacterized protein